MKKPDQKLSQAMEDYRETIYVLSKDKGYARTGEIARSLCISIFRGRDGRKDSKVRFC